MGSCRYSFTVCCTERTKSWCHPGGVDVNWSNMLALLAVLLYGSNESTDWTKTYKSHTFHYSKRMGQCGGI